MKKPIRGNYGKFSRKLALKIKKGAVGILPTDTLYGLVGSAFSRRAIARIYELKERSAKKQLIVLISELNDLKLFGAKLDKKTQSVLKKVWPGKVSVILPVRGKSVAFRLPDDRVLRKFLNVSGPLVAPSANREGEPPAKNIREARQYFGDRADFYLDKGMLKSKPSTLIALKNGRVKIIREGAVNVYRAVENG
ncbi:MAG: L-threonylcarbamoyladenylate synthase [Patescibacteria group bacterium]